MKELSDEELDELFRKSVEEFDPKYEASDWQDLRRRLDEADGITGGWWFRKSAPRLASLLLLLLVGGISIYYYYTGDTTIASSTINKEASPTVISSSSQNKKSETKAESSIPPRRRAALSEDEPDSEIDNGKLVRQDKKQSLVSEQRGIRKAREDLSERIQIKELPRNPASVSGVRKQTTPDRGRGAGAILLSQKIDNPGIGKPMDIGRNEVPTGVSQQESDSTRFQNGLSPIDALSFRSKFLSGDGLPYPAVVFDQPLDIPAPPSEQLKIKVPQWSVRVGISPDISTVRLSQMMQSITPGPAASLLVEGSISQRWSLQTGIIRSLKIYQAKGSEYEWTWTYKQPQGPSSVNGNCTVFELPVNIRFDISQRPMSRWFVGAGVSSYKMQKEKYTYEYYTYVHNPIKSWESKTSSGWSFFSHANASVGYERFITKRLSLIAEPYVKIPLRGVGIGKVNLYSTGIWFSARYTPVFRK